MRIELRTVKDARDQESGEDKEQVDADPAGVNQRIDKVDCVRRCVAVGLEDMQRHHHHDGESAQAIQAADVVWLLIDCGGGKHTGVRDRRKLMASNDGSRAHPHTMAYRERLRYSRKTISRVILF